MATDKETLEEIYLPSESMTFLGSVEGQLSINPYLMQNRFCRRVHDKRGDKIVPLLYLELRNDTVGGEKFDQLMEIAGILNKRTEALAQSQAGRDNCDFYPFQPRDRMMIGEGGDMYLHMQPLRLHPLYGLPFIPASAIKGVLRSAWILEKCGGDTDRALEDPVFRNLFGSNETDSGDVQGELIFFDIFPERFSIGLDVQTPHSKDYYQGQKMEPRDDVDPTPILFVCLSKAKFDIWVACRDKGLWERHKGEIDRMMDIAFTQIGIGAKGALGYGIGIGKGAGANLK